MANRCPRANEGKGASGSAGVTDVPAPATGRLFVDERGKPIIFHVAPGSERSNVVAMIEAGGGAITKMAGSAGVWHVWPKDEVTEPLHYARGGASGSVWRNAICAAFIKSCVQERRLLPFDDFAVTFEGVAAAAAATPAPRASTQATQTSFGAAKSMPVSQASVEPGCAPRGGVTQSTSANSAVRHGPRVRAKFTPEDDDSLLRWVEQNIGCRIMGKEIWKSAETKRITTHPWQSMQNRWKKHISLRPEGAALASASSSRRRSVPKTSRGSGSEATPGRGVKTESAVGVSAAVRGRGVKTESVVGASAAVRGRGVKTESVVVNSVADDGHRCEPRDNVGGRGSKDRTRGSEDERPALAEAVACGDRRQPRVEGAGRGSKDRARGSEDERPALAESSASGDRRRPRVEGGGRGSEDRVRGSEDERPALAEAVACRDRRRPRVEGGGTAAAASSSADGIHACGGSGVASSKEAPPRKKGAGSKRKRAFEPVEVVVLDEVDGGSSPEAHAGDHGIVDDHRSRKKRRHVRSGTPIDRENQHSKAAPTLLQELVGKDAEVVDISSETDTPPTLPKSPVSGADRINFVEREAETPPTGPTSPVSGAGRLTLVEREVLKLRRKFHEKKAPGGRLTKIEKDLRDLKEQAEACAANVSMAPPAVTASANSMISGMTFVAVPLSACEGSVPVPSRMTAAAASTSVSSAPAALPSSVVVSEPTAYTPSTVAPSLAKATPEQPAPLVHAPAFAQDLLQWHTLASAFESVPASEQASASPPFARPASPPQAAVTATPVVAFTAPGNLTGSSVTASTTKIMDEADSLAEKSAASAASTASATETTAATEPCVEKVPVLGGLTGTGNAGNRAHGTVVAVASAPEQGPLLRGCPHWLQQVQNLDVQVDTDDL
eukprot:TRINITY_DN11128_c0_g1_i1.p1 TRINITY_DN11128_c0_g1~~TRINITY_DN11128_c0_g1_i1.p1  ORF type:complete len:919 (-),score=144.24 TRINITY_DN11128_c0_g1_i1:57-2744(-)